MTLTNAYLDVNITVLIRECYGKFNSFRVAKLGMQEITEAYQFVVYERKVDVLNSF